MEETKLNFLLIGKTGQGKSATGNTILGRRVFKISSKVTSKTKVVNYNVAHFDKYTLLMVDGPGLDDTDLDIVQDKITAAKHMDTALAMCNGVVDAFLLVIKFGNRFEQEDRNAIDAFKWIFGDEFLEHIIVVMTCGDRFQGAMDEEGTPDKGFHEWIREQGGVFRKLYNDCAGRFVLFDNIETDDGKKRAQIQEVVQLAENLKIHRGRYTSQYFEAAKYERDRFFLTKRAPQLKDEFKIKISSLVTAIESCFDAMTIRADIDDLRHEIDQNDQGYGVLLELKEIVTRVEENLDDMEQLVRLGQELERIRQSKTIWGVSGLICSVAGGAVTAVHPVGILVAAVGALAAGISSLVCDSNAEEVEQQQQEILSKNEKKTMLKEIRDMLAK